MSRSAKPICQKWYFPVSIKWMFFLGMTMAAIISTYNCSHVYVGRYSYNWDRYKSQFYLDYNPAYDEQDQTDQRESVDKILLSDVSSPLLPTHQRCCSHTLNLVASTDLINGISRIDSLKLLYADIFQKSTKLWTLTNSPLKYEVIVEFLGQALKRPVVTRWNSFFDAYGQIVELKSKILGLLEKLEITDSLTASDFMWVFIEYAIP